MDKKNIVLIGMPGAGKSTIGVLLAKAMKMPFIDTDLLIQQKSNRFLQDIINNDGLESFMKIEEEVISELHVINHIIATGGSAIYSEKAITHLKEHGILVYLDAKLYQIESRIKNISTRGIAMGKGKSLADILNHRAPLYKKFADIEINCSHKHIEIIVAEIMEKVKGLM